MNPERVPCRKCGHLLRNDISTGWYGLYEEIMMVKDTKRACNNCGVGFARINKYQMKLLALFSVCLATIVLLMGLGPKEYQEFFFNIFTGFVIWCFLFPLLHVIDLLGAILNDSIFKSSTLEKLFESKKWPTFYALFALSIVVLFWSTDP